MARVSALTGELILDVNKWTAGVRQAQTDAGALGKAISPLTNIATAAGAALLGMATAAAGALVATTKVAADYGDKIRDASVRTGLVAETLSGLKYQVEQSGASFEDLNTGLRILARNFSEAAASGKGQAAEAFKAVGVSVKDLKESGGNLEPILRKVADRMAEMPEGAQKTALAMQLMGRGGDRLIETMSGGSAAMDIFKSKADLFGLTVGRDATNAADAFNDALNNLKQATLGLSLSIGNELTPIGAELINWLSAGIIVLKDFTKTAIALGEVGLQLSATLRAVASVIGLLAMQSPTVVAFGARLATVKMELDRVTRTGPVLGDEMVRLWREATAAAAKHTEEVSKSLALLQKIKDQVLEDDLRAYQESVETQTRVAEDNFKRQLELIEERTKTTLDGLRRIEIAEAHLRNITLDGLVLIGLEAEAMWDGLAADIAIQADIEERNRRRREEELDKLTKANEAAAQRVRDVWTHAVGNITSDFAKGLADVIFEGKKFGDAMVDIAKSTARSMFEAFLSGLLAPLTTKLGELGAKLGGVLFGGAGAAGGGGSILGGAASAGGGILGGIFGKGAGAAVGTTALTLGGAALTGGIAAGLPLLVDLIGGIGSGRKSANKIVGSQNAFQKAVESILGDTGLSALNQSKQIQNLWDAFLANSQAFAAGGGPNATTSNQAFATLLPWISNIQSGLAKKIGNGETGGGPQTVNNYNVTIVVPEGKNARATVALFQSEGIPTFINWIQNNTGGITSAVTVAVKNSLQGVVTTA